MAHPGHRFRRCNLPAHTSSAPLDLLGFSTTNSSDKNTTTDNNTVQLWIYLDPTNITLRNTPYKKDQLGQSQINKMQASKTTMLNDRPTDSKRPKFIQLTLKPKSFKTTKMAVLTRSQVQTPNHIEVLPILPLINCGACANCE